MISWFDQPVLDLDRAAVFYRQVLSAEVSEEYPGMAMIRRQGIAHGCLVCNENQQPNEQGVLLYFSVPGRLDSAVAAVEHCGGRILKATHEIKPWGRRAIVLDSEGNRIALHSS